MVIPREVGKQAKKLTNTRELKAFKQTLHLSQLQKDFLFGTLLGDGCLITSRSGKAARLQVRHNRNYKEYVLWKYSLFKGWVRTQPREDLHNNSFYFRTVSHPELMEVKRLFYNKINRFVPGNISNIFMNPLSLAVWVMDDGNGYKDRIGFRLNSYGFGLDGNVLLQNCLQQNFKLNTTIYNDSKGYVLYFPKQSTLRLHQIIQEYILPCMKYKFATLTP